MFLAQHRHYKPSVLKLGIQQIQQTYRQDEWVWVRNKYAEYFGVELDKIQKDQLLEAIEKYLKVKSKFFTLVAADAEKEFSELSRTGFGQDGLPDDEQKDFAQIRGSYEENSFVKEIKQSLADLNKRIERLKTRLGN